jgi:hypothetical protein
MWLSRLVYSEHQRPPAIMMTIEARNTILLPAAIAIGIEMRLPRPISGVGYVIKSLVLVPLSG